MVRQGERRKHMGEKPWESSMAGLRRNLVWAGILLLLIPNDARALAYTDPGTGALLWQMLVAGLVGAAFYLRKFLTWIKGKRQDKRLGQ